jgi:hypothetical protein
MFWDTGISSSAGPSSGDRRQRLAVATENGVFSHGRREAVNGRIVPARRGGERLVARRSERSRSDDRGPRVRGLGRGRTTRRALARGGAGVAQHLNDVLGGWTGVRVTPMFGRWGYFAGGRLFACFPLRAKEHDLWVRLSPAQQARALGAGVARPHRRFSRRGWVEIDVATADDLGRALRWLRAAHTAALRSADDGEDEDQGQRPDE